MDKHPIYWLRNIDRHHFDVAFSLCDYLVDGFYDPKNDLDIIIAYCGGGEL